MESPFQNPHRPWACRKGIVGLFHVKHLTRPVAWKHTSHTLRSRISNELVSRETGFPTPSLKHRNDETL